MHREPLLQLLSRYKPLDGRDSAQLATLVSFIKEHPDCFSRSLECGHVTASAWLLDSSQTRILLTHHRKLNKWLQPGGHADGNPDALSVALQEAMEESGINHIQPLSEAIFDIDIHPIPERDIPGSVSEPEHLHYDLRFALKVHGPSKYIVSSESYDLAWVKINKLHTLTCEESLLRMREKWLLANP
ncbi:NUDIX hydrolase [Oligoflexia bacterium]|nr:NUDIX hydrolase [Oligoflexia bacterium]